MKFYVKVKNDFEKDISFRFADKNKLVLSCNSKQEGPMHQSLRLRTFLFESITACKKSTTLILFTTLVTLLVTSLLAPQKS